MSLVRWDPFKDLLNLQNSITRLMESSLGHDFQGLTRGFATDISEDNENIYVKAELPGMDPEDIKISITNDQLIIQGEKKQETKRETTNWVRTERSYGSFSRVFNLGVPVREDGIQAKYRKGVLEIVLPKDEKA